MDGDADAAVLMNGGYDGCRIHRAGNASHIQSRAALIFPPMRFRLKSPTPNIPSNDEASNRL